MVSVYRGPRTEPCNWPGLSRKRLIDWNFVLVEDCHSMRGNGNFLKVVRKIYENVPATFTCSKSLRKIKLRKSMELLFNNYSQFVSYKKTLYIRITCFQIFGVEKNCRRICRRRFLSNEPFYIVNKRDVSSARALEDPRGSRSNKSKRDSIHAPFAFPCPFDKTVQPSPHRFFRCPGDWRLFFPMRHQREREKDRVR